ncbi:hypothetical protein [Streptomyces lavenduligriseus]|uniref:Lipoprotein n=1 Tax=Streptomyces lavenduligriseus TaxID=67315 RepID=A0ABT0NKY6_9ACTN|nr:hypothetical protein [Streptomyces lavenduligriseus]MCL3992132.1 hypothetical protein [Streptomyces lavenduligriseus]
MRRSATLIGISAIAVLASACSSGSDDQAAGGKERTTSAMSSAAPAVDAGREVRAAVDSTKQSTARIDDRIRLNGMGQDYTITVKGAFDMKADRGSLKVSLTQTNGAVLHEVFHGNTVYFRMPEEMNGDTGWRSTSRDEAEVHALLRAPLNDPEFVLRQVSMAHGLTAAGEEKVNGVPARHYTGKLDHKPLLLRMVKERREKAEEAMAMIGDELPATADVWVTKDGLITRVLLVCDLAGMKVSSTMNLTDVGKPVTMASPPKSAQAMPAALVGGALPG